MTGGYMERIGFVDLSTNEVKEEKLDEAVAEQFIGGYGLGVRVLFERQRKRVDPLGPENLLGFTTGPLTGTPTPTGGRYMAVCKSPLTGTWGDANSGGHFGSVLKAAGWDALFVSGVASTPKMLLATEEGIEIRDASHLWGKDAIETEELLRRDLAVPGLSVACIGPASEKGSLISGIVNDQGRIAARSGVGAVMGSKRLKAVVVHGKRKVTVSDPERLDGLRRDFLAALRDAEGFPKALKVWGTSGLTGALIAGGATPIKNWLFAGEQAFPTHEKISDGDTIIRYQLRKYGCANCPIACGGILSVPKGPYAVKDVHKVEYETVGAFGAMCLNDDLPSIIKMNDICNRSGLDTISAGSVLAFAMECYERGLITRSDTDGIELTWGNAPAMIAVLKKIEQREGLGDLLADGVKVAAQKIGKGADACAMHVGGQEPGLHNALFLPGRGTGFVCDPTPGRHTAAPMARLDGGPAVVAPYPELQFPAFERYDFANKGPASAVCSAYAQVGNCAGVCLFPLVFFGNYPMLDFLSAVTGWELNVAEALETGRRIQTLRQAFNEREGIASAEMRLPNRMAGIPPKIDGPLAGVTVDMDALARAYRGAMGWDPETGSPTDATLERLGLKGLTERYG